MPPLDKVYDYSQYGGLLVTKQDKVMTITLNAPESMNAFSAEMHYSMSRIWEDVHDDPEVNVVVLTGAGRAFSAGGNVIAMQEKINRPELWERHQPAGSETDHLPHAGMRQAGDRAGQRPCRGAGCHGGADVRHHHRRGHGEDRRSARQRGPGGG
jgi:enoyl-CoA hydratase/carnithine racemase